MAHIINLTFQLKRGTTARWNDLNPILKQGEPGFELDTNKLKIGDGETAWNELPYLSINIADIIDDLNIPSEETIAAIAEARINNLIGIADNLDNVTLQSIANLVDYVEQNGGQISELITQSQEMNHKITTIESNTNNLSQVINNVTGDKYLIITNTGAGLTLSFNENALKLSALAKSGNINDLHQDDEDYLLLDCGTASINM